LQPGHFTLAAVRQLVYKHIASRLRNKTNFRRV
jgi:hypothetical protein